MAYQGEEGGDDQRPKGSGGENNSPASESEESAHRILPSAGSETYGWKSKEDPVDKVHEERMKKKKKT